MTVSENVGFGLGVRRLPAPEIRGRVGEMLEVVKLGGYAERYPAELSGGQQQRVALARAMIVRPEVLLLDEPLSNLDANLREEMAAEIRRLHDEFGFTTVYVTHDQAEAMTISDRIAVLNHGRLEQIDTPWNLYNRPRTPFVAGFIGKTNLGGGARSATAGSASKAGARACRCSSPATCRLSPLAGVGTVPMQPAAAAGKAAVQVSIRPQSLFLGTANGQGLPLGLAAVVARTYLGECWDYAVRPVGEGPTLKVHAPPCCVLTVGQESVLYVDPDGIAAVS